MSTTRSQRSPTKESSGGSSGAFFPIGPAAKRELRRALVRSTDPAATIQSFQQSHSLHSMMARAFGTTPHHHHEADDDDDSKKNVETLDTDSVMMFVSHLGLTQHEIHKRISDSLLKQLEDEIRKTQSDKPLLDLLKNCWAYATVTPELRPVLWSTLKQLGERTPLAVLKALSERDKTTGQLKHAEIFRPLTPLLKRLCWEADWDGRIPVEPDTVPKEYLQTVESTLLSETVQPIMDEYCSNRWLVQAANLPFVATIRERKVLTTQRRALTTTTTTTTSTASSTTTTGTVTMPASLLRSKPTAVSAASASSGLTSGKSVAQLRNLLSDDTVTGGSAVVYRPKLLYALLSMLVAQHGAQTTPFLGGATHLHCTLTADILLSAGGSLPKAYHHVLNLARVLDDCVQEGNMADDALVQLQTTLSRIFQPDVEGDDDDAAAAKKKKEMEDMEQSGASPPTTNAMKRQLNKLITAGLVAMKDADPQNLFGNPVTDKIAPGYSRVIKKPMCISSMERKVAKNVYNSLTDWESDVKLMFKNCIDYNRGEGGQWFRGEAHRQGRVFREEIFAQAKRLYQKEIAKRTQQQQDGDGRKKRKAEEEKSESDIKPLAPSTKKRKKNNKDEYLPSMPALASMLLADPFVVRILLARVLRDLLQVRSGSALPVAHAAIPSLLQVLHLARWSTQLCAIRGKRFFVPDAGLERPAADTQDPPMLVPFLSLRQFLPLLLRLIVEEQLDRRMTQGGDLYNAGQSNPDLKPPTLDDSKWRVDNKEQVPLVVVSLVESAMVHLCQPGHGNEASLSATFPKFAQALQALSQQSLQKDAVFFRCLIRALLQHKSKLPKPTRDAVVASWLDWLRLTDDDDDDHMKICSAAHEYLVRLLNEWSALGNLVLPRDTLVEFATDAVRAVAADTNKFASMWPKEEFGPVRKQYERMLRQLPAAQAKEWKQTVGIETDDSAAAATEGGLTPPE